MDLEDWVRGVHPRITGLELAGLSTDFSRESLADLAVAAFDDDLDARDVAAYLGETLMRAGGGRWTVAGDRPAVTADPALGLPVVVPAELIPARTEHDFTAVYDQWAAAAAARTASDPQWRPAKEPTPGLDPLPVTAPAPLAGWLAARAAAFPGWVAGFAPDESWDFSPASLDRLTALLTRSLADARALGDPAHHDLVDGAAWYLGETFRRAGRGQWSWQTDPELPPGPFIANAGPGLPALFPVVQLRIGMRTPGALHRRLDSLRP